MTWSMGVALVVTIGAIAALIKRCETRLVLLSAGILMALLSLEPMIAFKQFDKSMTNATLIIAICSAMGFASVVSLTKCDVHLVALLTKPLKKLGLMLLPACMLVVSLISIAIPSTSGLVAAVGPTIIPLMVRAGFHPAIAAASVVGRLRSLISALAYRTTPSSLSSPTSRSWTSSAAGCRSLSAQRWPLLF